MFKLTLNGKLDDQGFRVSITTGLRELCLQHLYIAINLLTKSLQLTQITGDILKPVIPLFCLNGPGFAHFCYSIRVEQHLPKRPSNYKDVMVVCLGDHSGRGVSSK